MASSAEAAVGATFKRGDGASSESFVALGEVINWEWTGMEADEIEVTYLGSTGGNKEFIRGFKDPGTLQMECNFVNADYDTFLADYDAGDNHNWQMAFADTDTSTFSFTGFVQALPVSANAGEQLKCNVTIRLTGTPSISS
jgi:hypothetical protein